MSPQPKKNLAASVRQRLSNQARATGRPFQEVFEYFVMERFLYRLSQSPHADKFVLKGALMFTVWGVSAARATRDIDLLARMTNDPATIAQVVRDICLLATEPDGVRFEAASLQTKTIKEDADYQGVRVVFMAYLQNMRFSMQLDIGFGDVTYPPPIVMQYPTLLDLPAPRLKTYGRETVVAEKFEALASLGMLNTRMKDYFDLWLLSRHFDFDGSTLVTAVAKTFANRGTQLVEEPTGLTTQFATDDAKTKQWRAFLLKSRLNQAPTDLTTVVADIGLFLLPVAQCVSRGDAFTRNWTAPGPWSEVVTTT